MFNQINRQLLLKDVSNVFFFKSCVILTVTKHHYKQLKSQVQAKTKYTHRLYSLIRISTDVFYVSASL